MDIENKALERVKFNNAKLSKKKVVWVITNTIKAKRKMPIGVERLITKDFLKWL